MTGVHLPMTFGRAKIQGKLREDLSLKKKETEVKSVFSEWS